MLRGNATFGKPEDFQWTDRFIEYAKNVKLLSSPKPIVLPPHQWTTIRLYISSTIPDTHEERNIIVRKVMSSVNRQVAHKYIRVIPLDLRWGNVPKENDTCEKLQTIYLNAVDQCRFKDGQSRWFISLQTKGAGNVQEKIASSDRFKNPENFAWIGRMQGYPWWPCIVEDGSENVGVQNYYKLWL